MSREKIISAIKANKPESFELPEIPRFNNRDKNLLEMFCQNAELSGAALVPSSNQSIEEKINQLFPDASQIASTLGSYAGNVELDNIDHPSELKSIDVAVLRAELGVADNGAVWLSDQTLPKRILPFITQHLVVLLKKEDIVYSMHDAYAKIDPHDMGFGVFICGPSKTADIEQSVVIGAHGPISFTIILE